MYEGCSSYEDRLPEHRNYLLEEFWDATPREKWSSTNFILYVLKKFAPKALTVKKLSELTGFNKTRVESICAYQAKRLGTLTRITEPQMAYYFGKPEDFQI